MSVKVYTAKKTLEDGHDHQAKMQEVAEEVVLFQTRPMPQAEDPPLPFFPPRVIRGLWSGILVGAITGLAFGYLLLNQILNIPGWEMLYSMWPSAFIFFWIFMGIALGILLLGVGSILLTPGIENEGGAG